MLLCYSDRWRVKQKVPDWSWLIRICWLPLEYLRVHLQHIDTFPLPGWLGCYRLLLIFWHLLTMFHWWRIHSDSLSFSPVFSIFFSHNCHNSVQQKVQLSRNSAATRLPLGCHSAATRLPLGFQVASKGSSKGWDSWGKVSGAAVLCQVLQVLHEQKNNINYT